MMLTALLLAGMVSAGSAELCAATVLPRTEAGLVEAEHLWIMALEARDAGALGCILDGSFTDNSWNGTVRGRSDLIGALQGRPAGRIELQELKTRVAGETGIATGVTVLRGASGEAVNSARFMDVFLYREGRWKAIAAQETGLQRGSPGEGKR